MRHSRERYILVELLCQSPKTDTGGPAYAPPPRHSLGGGLLEAEHGRVMTQVEDKINCPLSVTLLTDGWTNVLGDSILNFVVATPMPIFYNAVETERQRHTGEYITGEISQATGKVGKE